MEIGKGLTASKSYADSIVSLAAKVKNHSQNFDNACKMYFASEDQIAELKADIKKEPGSAKLNAELKKWETNHPKLGARVKAEDAELEKIKAGIAMAKKAGATIRAAYAKLNQGLAKSAITGIPAAKVDLKSMDTQLNAADKEIKRLESVIEKRIALPYAGMPAYCAKLVEFVERLYQGRERWQPAGHLAS